MIKEKIWPQIQRDLRIRGVPEGQIHYVRQILGEEGYTRDYDTSNRSSVQLENLTDLNNQIEDKQLDELLESTDDAVPLIAQHDLSYDQLQKLTPATKQEYRDTRKKLISEQKAKIHHIDSNFEQKMGIAGLTSQEEKDKESTQIPPKALWGTSQFYWWNRNLGDVYSTMGKYHYDVGQQSYVFKPSKEIDKESSALMERYWNEIAIPILKASSIVAYNCLNIMDNIQDEKNRDTLLGWMKKAVDKHWNYGNHGAGEVDFIPTGEVIMKLQPDNRTILRIPIKREFTREQVGDKTTVEVAEEQNQVFVTCPECKLEFNKPIITDERRDLFTGDLFNKSVTALIAHVLSGAMESIADNVIIIEKKTPEQFLLEALKKKGMNIENLDISNLKVIDEKHTKIKEVDIDPDTKVAEELNIMYGRAGRTQNKSEHFSDQA